MVSLKAYMFLEKCWFDSVHPELCPSDQTSLKNCIVPTTKDELCEASYPWPAGTRRIDNCGYDDVYTTGCGGTNLVSNPCVT